MPAGTAVAGTVMSRYQVPSVKDDFCGIYINYQYCKCAFHNEYCEDVGLTPGSAHSYVLSEFREWNRQRIQTMATQCRMSDGYWKAGNWSCTTCTDGDVLEGQKCVAPEKSDSEKRECRDALKNIDTDWEKYSDFDDRLGSDVSYEVGQFNTVMDEIATMVARAHELEYDMEIDRAERLALREYKQALVQETKVNLLKAFWRLSYVTYTTIKSGKGTSESLGKMLNPESVVEGIGAGLKTIQAHIPASATDYQIDTNSTAGKIKSIAWNATLETIESVGDPKSIATQFVKDVHGASLPSPNISDEEVAILRNQYLSNQAVDTYLAQSYELNAQRRTELLALEKQITEKYNELQQWKYKEYTRVKGMLEDQCKDDA